jgi:hypothetical protein
MFQSLPVIAPQEIRSLNRDIELQHMIIDLRRDLATAARRIELPTLLALARQRFPGESDREAVEKLAIEIRAALNTLAEHGASVRALAQAEKERQAPLIAEAGRRDFEFQRKIEGIDRKLHFLAGEEQDDKSREARRIKLVAERNVLKAEQESLGLFLRTRDESLLPEGFTVRDCIRVGT